MRDAPVWRALRKGRLQMARGTDLPAVLQVVEPQKQRIGVGAIFEREMRAHREDLLSHQAQLLDDGEVGAAFDGAQRFGDVGHGWLSKDG